MQIQSQEQSQIKYEFVTVKIWKVNGTNFTRCMRSWFQLTKTVPWTPTKEFSKISVFQNLEALIFRLKPGSTAVASDPDTQEGDQGVSSDAPSTGGELQEQEVSVF